MGMKFRHILTVILFLLPILLGVSPDSLILNVTSWDSALSSFVLLHRILIIIFGPLIVTFILIIPPTKYRALFYEIYFVPYYIRNFFRLRSEIFSKNIKNSGGFYLGRIYVVFTNIEINKTIDFQFYFYNGNYEKVKILAIEGFIDFERDGKSPISLNRLLMENPFGIKWWASHSEKIIFCSVPLEDQIAIEMGRIYESGKDVKLRLSKLRILICRSKKDHAVETLDIWPIIYCRKVASNNRTDISKVNEASINVSL